MNRGRRIFRFDTFGDEAFWGGTLKLHQAIEGARFGGNRPNRLHRDKPTKLLLLYLLWQSLVIGTVASLYLWRKAGA